MLVKKKNSEWFPSENKGLKVGETIEISDPRALIIAGDAIGLADDGVTELSAFELYGVIVADEAQEFREYLQLKKAEAAQTSLKAEKESLKTQLEKEAPLTELKPVEVPVVETKVAETKVEAKKN